MDTRATLQQAVDLHQQGRLKPAKALYESILIKDKSNVDALNLLGTLLAAEKHFRQAEKYLLKACNLAPKYASANYNLGRVYLEQNLPKKAFGPIFKAVTLKPNFADAVFVLANIQVRLAQYEDAEQGYKKVIKIMPQHYEAWNNLGGVLQEQGKPDKAISCHRQSIQLQPNFQLAYISLATALQATDRQHKAVECLKGAIGVGGGAVIYHKLGVIYQQLGLMEEARDAYLKAIYLEPSFGACYRGYAEITRISSENNIAFIESARSLDMNDENRMHFDFAWAKVQDSLKNYDQAFVAYKAGNDLHRASYEYSVKDSEALFRVIKSSYTADFFVNGGSLTGKGSGVVFILGMPRSGTTLVEQIISSHSSVYGAGELEYLGDFGKKFSGGGSRFHRQLPQMDRELWQNLSESYLAETVSLCEGAPYVTDKMPDNFLNIGLIRKLLPEAKIIHCKRHPIANCLSIYKAFFTAKGSHKYAYDLKELAEYHNFYEDLMAHWRQVIPGQFYEVKYEDLTKNQEYESRKLVEYCGLGWEETCLEFYRSKRKIKTASAFQVRQPMSTKSVDLWKQYGVSLQPLIDVLHIPDEYSES